MMTAIERWHISSMFIDVLLKFGDQPQVFQESSGFRQSYQAADGSFGQLAFRKLSCIRALTSSRAVLPVHVY